MNVIGVHVHVTQPLSVGTCCRLDFYPSAMFVVCLSYDCSGIIFPTDVHVVSLLLCLLASHLNLVFATLHDA